MHERGKYALSTVLFPGSFNPPTLGHVDLIKRASCLYDKVIVAVLVNINKTSLFSLEDRVAMLNKCCMDLPNVQIISYHGLLVDLAKELNVKSVLRGVRTLVDFEYERNMASANRIMYNALETLMLPSSPGLEGISSSTVRELIEWGKPLDGFVPPEIIPMLVKKPHQ